jgi:hypothetical protein
MKTWIFPTKLQIAPLPVFLDKGGRLLSFLKEGAERIQQTEEHLNVLLSQRKGAGKVFFSVSGSATSLRRLFHHSQQDHGQTQRCNTGVDPRKICVKAIDQREGLHESRRGRGPMPSAADDLPAGGRNTR